MAEDYAKAFLSIGVKNGDVVTVVTAGTMDTILYFAGLNKIGAVIQFVNPNYMKFNSKKYINDTGCKILICLDRFYPLIKDAIAETNVSTIIAPSISEYFSPLYKSIIRGKKIKKSERISGVKYYNLKEFLKKGTDEDNPLSEISYEISKPAIITYTSGTTGDPKGVVHTNDSMNNMLDIYQISGGFGASEGVRNLVLITPMYLTSFVHSVIGPMSVGAINILQPIYRPKNLGKDIMKYKPETVVASKAHYIYLEEAKLKRGSLHNTKYAYCGGEAISRAVAQRINKTLEYYGIAPMVLGYGQTEFGTMTMFNIDIPDRVNESGILIPKVRAKIVDFKTGKDVLEGERGELWIQSPAVMKEYFNNQSATDAFFVQDENGETWAKTGDVAEIKYRYNGEPVYEVSGRASDSFVDEEGNIVYLFDIEMKVEEASGVREAEVVSLTVDGRKVPVVHLILDEESKGKEQEILSKIDSMLRENAASKNAVPYAYKIRDGFATSPISGKRNYEILQYETEGYFIKDKDGHFEKTTIISEESKIENKLLQSNIIVG